MRSKKRKEMKDTPRPPPSKKRKKWRLELRKELQQKRKQDFSQAEKEKENIERKRRKITPTENEIPQGENQEKGYTEEGKYCPQQQGPKTEVPHEISQHSSPNAKQNQSYFSIFKFTAVRQKGESKVNTKPSTTQKPPPKRKNVNPNQSSTLKQPKQPQITRIKGLKMPPYNFKKISEFFNPITNTVGDGKSIFPDQDPAGLEESENNTWPEVIKPKK